MAEHAIAARREGDLIAIEDVEVGGEYGEVLTTQYLDADGAIRFGEALAALGRRIRAEATGKVLSLAGPYAIYPEDAAE